MAESGCQWLWQTGRLYYEEIRKSVAGSFDEKISINAFIDRMDYAYAAADIIISRAGAGTISELCLVGKPSILVPSPNVAEDHQTRNAMALAGRNAAIMIPDENVGKILVNEAISLASDSQKKQLLSENISKMAERDADKRIAEEVLKLAER
jgi:UDP-N-acetylglucosamine--N-acetylmuramyl-(pentapeptide) pyrophosphoryl-undecaprenol N-acetylglucosamine transferase